jgi:hypothetical protein
MKKMKLAAFCAALMFTTAGAGFAQVSNTYTATAGTFKTDVDNFMDVNDWNTVKPKNIFGYTGFAHNNIDLGLAKQFKNFYAGVYFNGNLWSGNIATESTVDTNSVETHNFTSGTSSNNVSLFAGVGNWGFKGELVYQPNSSLTTESNTSNTTSKTDSQYYYMNTSLSAGTNITAKGITFKPHASLGVIVNSNKTTTKTSGTAPVDTTADSGYSQIYIGLGSGFVFPEKYNIKQSALFDTSFYFSIYPSESATNNVTNSSTAVVRSGNYIILSPSYLVQTKPVEKLGLNAKVSAPITFKNTHQGDTTVTTNGTSVTTAGNTDYNDITFKPTVALGLQYTAVPDKFIVNSGFSVTIPSFEYTNTNDKEAGTQDQSWAYGSVTTAATFGFQYFFVKDIGISTTMNLFSYSNASSSQTSEISTSLSTIWSSSVSFDFTIKL